MIALGLVVMAAVGAAYAVITGVELAEVLGVLVVLGAGGWVLAAVCDYRRRPAPVAMATLRRARPTAVRVSLTRMAAWWISRALRRTPRRSARPAPRRHRRRVPPAPPSWAAPRPHGITYRYGITWCRAAGTHAAQDGGRRG